MVLAKKNGQVDTWDRIESPEVGPHKNSQLIFAKEAKAIQWRKDSFSTNGAGTEALHAKK